MQKILFLLFTVLTLTVSAQNLPYAKEVVNELASEKYFGRGYLKNGDKLAADYIAGEFKRLGVEKLDGHESYFQPFKMNVNTFPSTVALSINGEKLVGGTDFLVTPESRTIEGEFTAKVYKRKDFLSREGLIKVIGEVGEGIVLINNRKDKESKEDSKAIDENINLLRSARDISIKCIILFSDEKLTWGVAPYVGRGAVFQVKKDIALKKKMKVYVSLKNKFLRNHKTQNVCGIIKGTEKPDSVLMVTAHYDHLGGMGDKVYFPGANDNASGVAMMLNLAEHYKKTPPRYSVVFVALAAEEAGLLGAKEFVTNPPVQLSSIRFLVNFDLAGTGDEGVRVVNGSVFKTQFDFLRKVNEEKKLLPKIDIRGEACISDHCFFYEKGVPCFYIYTQGGIQAYHDVYDRYETLPFTEFEDYFRLMVALFDSF